VAPRPDGELTLTGERDGAIVPVAVLHAGETARVDPWVWHGTVNASDADVRFVVMAAPGEMTTYFARAGVRWMRWTPPPTTTRPAPPSRVRRRPSTASASGHGSTTTLGRLPRVPRLYRRPLSGRPVRAAWILEEAGASYDLVNLTMEETREAAHLARHPLGRVPVLEDDGGLLYESAAVCLQVADAHPEAGLIGGLGTRERGLAYQWILFAMTELEPSFLPLLPNRDTEPAAAEAAKAALRERLAVLEDALDGRATDARAPAGDERDLVLQQHGYTPAVSPATSTARRRAGRSSNRST